MIVVQLGGEPRLFKLIKVIPLEKKKAVTTIHGIKKQMSMLVFNALPIQLGTTNLLKRITSQNLLWLKYLRLRRLMG